MWTRCVAKATTSFTVWRRSFVPMQRQLASSVRAGHHSAGVPDEDPVAEVVAAPRRDEEHLMFACGRGAAKCAGAFLRCLSSRGRLLFVAGDRAAVTSTQKLAASDSRVRVVRVDLRHLGQAIPTGTVIGGALLDLSSLSLPHHAAAWLAKASEEELERVFCEHGEQDDMLLWARLAHAVVSERARRSSTLQENSQLVSLIQTSIRTLGDPAGPSTRLTLDAIRSHLNQENQQLSRGLAMVLERLDIGSRCAIVCPRLAAASCVRHAIRSLEDCDPALVSEWPRELIFALYPLLSDHLQAWCVRDVSRHEAMGILPSTSQRAMQAQIIEKGFRKDYDWGVPSVDTPPLLFRQPICEPTFAGGCAPCPGDVNAGGLPATGLRTHATPTTLDMRVIT